MASRRVGGFRPSTNGFRFANDFPSEPLFEIPLGLWAVPIGNASDGLCGGMAFAARDLFEVGLPPPADPEPPPRGSPLFSYLIRRAFVSFDLPSGPLRYLAWMSLPTQDLPFGPRGLAWRTEIQEWPKVRADLDSGRLSSLGLIRARSLNPLDLGRNHQVLAYGYDLDERARALHILVYDPNHPGDDALSLEIGLQGAGESIGYVEGEHSVRGFFRTKPAAVSSSRAGRLGMTRPRHRRPRGPSPKDGSDPWLPSPFCRNLQRALRADS